MHKEGSLQQAAEEMPCKFRFKKGIGILNQVKWPSLLKMVKTTKKYFPS
jgi:hypothetical protein